jgi:hypothetical protein
MAGMLAGTASAAAARHGAARSACGARPRVGQRQAHAACVQGQAFAVALVRCAGVSAAAPRHQARAVPPPAGRARARRRAPTASANAAQSGCSYRRRGRRGARRSATKSAMEVSLVAHATTGRREATMARATPLR